MTASILDEAAKELEEAFDYYERQRAGLGHELLVEFRKGVDRVLQYPAAWHPLDRTYRRCQLHRFPYGIIYRADQPNNRVVIVCFMHLSRRPDAWTDRE